MTRGPLRRRAASVLGAAAAIAVLTARAPAGVPLVDPGGVPYRWNLELEQPNVVGGEVTFFVDVSDLSDVVNGPKTAGRAIRDAVQTWNAVPTSRLRFREDPTRAASGVNGLDRVNWIGFSSSELGRATFAATFPKRSGTQLLDTDVVLNDRDFSWDTWTEGVPGDADVQALVTHEWGHAIGIDHVPLRASTMYFASSTGEVSARTLAPDDVALAGSIYPNETYAATTGSIRGTVAVAGTADDRAAHVVAVSVATAEPAASAFSAPDGSFEIRGLPAGAYRVLAAPAVPLGTAMNPYWRSGSTTFVPGVAGDVPGNPAHARTILVGAGGAADAGTIPVAPASAVHEPNDTRTAAVPIAVGDGVAARFESISDEDWYAFDATEGQRLTASVLAYAIGSDADPSLRITDVDGTVLANQFDIRGSAFARTESGVDRDARIVGWTVPKTARYFVRAAQDVPAQSSQTFYVLFVTVASDAPSAVLTQVDAAPARIDAGSAQTSDVAVRPFLEDGRALGLGASVTLLADGAPLGAAAYSPLDGAFHRTVTARATPGRTVYAAVVTANGAATVAEDTATVVSVGPMDAAASSLSVFPRRLAADGAEQAMVRFVPRDALGETLGPGRAVAADVVPDRGAEIGPFASHEDGAYEATLFAGTEPGASVVEARVVGQAAAASAPVALGFALTEVLTAARADVAAFRGGGGLPKSAVTALSRAARQVDAALAAAAAAAATPTPQNELRALAKSAPALRSIATALKRAPSHLSDPGTAREIARAAQQLADAAIARAALAIRNAAQQRLHDRARDLSMSATSALSSGNAVLAHQRWIAAYRTVLPLL